MLRGVCSFVPCLTASATPGVVSSSFRLQSTTRRRCVVWSKRREPDAAHDDNDNELRGVERDDCGDEAAACTAAVAAAAENMLLQLDAGLEDSTVLFCDGLFDSVSEDGSGASRPAETDFDRYRGRDAHRAEDQPSEAKRTRSSMSTLTRGGRGAGRPTRARVRERAGRGKEVNSLTKRHQSLIREVKEASARRSWKDVLAAKEGARSRGLQLDGRSHTAFVHAGLDLRGPQGALEAIKDMRGDGFVPNLALYNKVISLCGRRGLWEEAIVLLRDVQAAGVSGRVGQGGGEASLGSIGVNVVTYSSAMAACRNGGKWEKALLLMEEMQEVGIRPDQIAFGTALSACAMEGEWQRALFLLAEMRRADLRPDVVAYSSAIRACGRGGRWEEALDLLREMEEEGGVTPNILTYTAAVEACGRAGQWQKALWLLAQVRDRWLQPDVVTLNAVMDALGRAGETEKALALLQTMRLGAPPTSTASWNSRTPFVTMPSRRGGGASASQDGHPRADVFTWSAAMTACIEGGEWARVDGMLDDMRSEGVQPNVINYNLSIKALAKGGKWQRAMELLKSMEAAGVSPDERTYSALIEACGRGGSWERALSLVDDMRQAGLSPDELIYSTVIAACDRGGAWDMALMVLDEARAGGVEDGGTSKANVFAYTAAISACGKAGQWEKAVSLLDAMRKDGVAPNAVSLRSVLQGLENAPPSWLATRRRPLFIPNSAFVPPQPVQGEEEKVSGASTPLASVPPIDLKAVVKTRDGSPHAPALPWEIAISLLEETARGGGGNSDDYGGGDFPSPRDFAVALKAALIGGAEWPSIIKVLDTMHARFVDHDTTAETDAAGGAAGTNVGTAAGSSVATAADGVVGTDAAATAAGGAAGANDVATGTFSAAAAPGEDGDGVRESEASSIDLDEGSGKRDPRCVKKAGLVQAYNHLIRACTSVGGVDVALELVEEMHRRGVKPDAASYSSAIVACDLAGMWSEAVDLLEDMRSSAGQEPDLVCYNCAIKACGSSGEWEAALDLLKTMRKRGIVPDEITYSSAIVACGNAGEVRKALGLLKEMKTEGVPAELITYNAALGACDKGGEWGATVSVLNDMKAADIQPDVISYSAAMSSSEKAGDWRATLDLYDQLRDNSSEDSFVGTAVYSGVRESDVSGKRTELPPPRLTLAALTACARGGEWKRAMELLREAKAKGGSRDDGGDGVRSHLGQASPLAFNAALVACAKGAEREAAEGREGGWREAVEILDIMGRSPDPISYGCAITACGFGRNVEACVGLLGEMIQRNLTPTLGNYLASLRACAAQGRADAAQEIMDSMASECVEPDARCYRFAAEAFRRSGENGDYAAEAFSQSERFLELAGKMEVNAAAGRMESARTAGFDLNKLGLTDTSAFEALLETTEGSVDFVGPGET